MAKKSSSSFEEMFPEFTAMRTNQYSLNACQDCQKKFNHKGKGRDSRAIRVRVGNGTGNTDFVMTCVSCAKKYKDQNK